LGRRRRDIGIRKFWEQGNELGTGLIGQLSRGSWRYVTAMPEQSVRCCPRCGGELLLMNVIPPFGQRPRILAVRCVDCDHPEFLNMSEDYRAWPARF
jgi:hypothetical protein